MPDRSIERRPRLYHVAFPMTLSTADLVLHIPEGYRRLDVYLAEVGLEDRGPPIIRYRRGSEVGPWDIEVGWLLENPHEAPAPFIADELPEGEYVVGWHDGPFSRIRETTIATMAWAQANGAEFDITPDAAGDHWACWYEVYLTEPLFGTEGPAGAVEVCLLKRA